MLIWSVLLTLIIELASIDPFVAFAVVAYPPFVEGKTLGTKQTARTAAQSQVEVWARLVNRSQGQTHTHIHPAHADSHIQTSRTMHQKHYWPATEVFGDSLTKPAADMAGTETDSLGSNLSFIKIYCYD